MLSSAWLEISTVLEPFINNLELKIFVKIGSNRGFVIYSLVAGCIK